MEVKGNINQHEETVLVITKLIRNPLITRSVNFISPPPSVSFYVSLYSNTHPPPFTKSYRTFSSHNLQYLIDNVLITLTRLKLPCSCWAISLILWKKIIIGTIWLRRNYDA